MAWPHKGATQQLPLARKLVKVIGPPLHHFAAFGQVLGMIVSGSDAVAFTVS